MWCGQSGSTQHSGDTGERGEHRQRRRGKQREAFISVSPNLLQLYVRVQGRGGRAGEGVAGAVANCSMVAFFLFRGRTHPGGIPPPGIAQVE